MTKLKYILTLLVVAGYTFLSSCGPEEDVKIAEVLLGRWNLQEVRVNGNLIVTDTANYRLRFNTDLDGNPTTYTIVGNPSTPRPNHNADPSITTGTWRLNATDTEVTFDPGTDRVSRVELGEFIIEVERFAYPLSWVDEDTGDTYECLMARFEDP